MATQCMMGRGGGRGRVAMVYACCRPSGHRRQTDVEI